MNQLELLETPAPHHLKTIHHLDSVAPAAVEVVLAVEAVAVEAVAVVTVVLSTKCTRTHYRSTMSD